MKTGYGKLKLKTILALILALGFVFSSISVITVSAAKEEASVIENDPSGESDSTAADGSKQEDTEISEEKTELPPPENNDNNEIDLPQDKVAQQQFRFFTSVNGQVSPEPFAEFSCANGDLIPAFDLPQFEGCRFVGIVDAEGQPFDLGQAIQFSSDQEGAVVDLLLLYEKTRVQTCRVFIYKDGVRDSLLYEKEIRDGDTLAALVLPEIDAYAFSGLSYADGTTAFDPGLPLSIDSDDGTEILEIHANYLHREKSQKRTGPRRIISPEEPAWTFIFKVEGKEVERQIVKNGELLLEPEAPLSEKGKFIGWFIEDEDTPLDFSSPIELDKNKTILVSARFKKLVHVFFMDDITPEARIIQTKEGSPGTEVSTTDVILPLDLKQKVVGWYLDPELKNGPVEANYTLGSEDQKLWPQIKEGNYIYFYSGQDASYVEPELVLPGDATQAPSEPTRPGYQFDHWSVSEGGTAFAFGGNLEEDLKLYAVWIPRTDTKYIISYWTENAEDSDYSLESSRVVTGTTESEIILQDNAEGYGKENLSSEYRDFFTFKKYDTGKVIKLDGSTVVNVYYTRNIYTMRFYHEQTGNAWAIGDADIKNCKLVYEFQAKYGQRIAKHFPVKGFENRNWHPFNHYLYDLQTIELMPGENVDFWCDLDGLDIEHTLIYLGEGLDGKYHELKRIPTVFSRITYEEEYHPIEGYKRLSPEDAGFYWDDEDLKGYALDLDSSEVELKYLRASFPLKMFNGKDEYKSQDVRYEEKLAPYLELVPDKPPKAFPEYYEFKGWYLEPQCAEGTEAKDHLKIMPSKLVHVYAKWGPPELKGFFYPRRDGGTPTTETLFYGQRVKPELFPTVKDAYGHILSVGDDTKAISIPRGYHWIGWSTKEGDRYIPFNLETVVAKDMSFYPYYVNLAKFKVTYDAGEGTGEVPQDPEHYAEHAFAVLLPPGELKAPEGKVFLAWKQTMPTGEEKRFQPGDKIQITEDVKLTALWGDIKEKTKVIYKAGLGSNDPEITREPILINDRLLLEKANLFKAKEGFEFIGWENASDGKVYAASYANLMIDAEKENTTNILIARWKQNVTAKKIWIGAPKTKPEITFSLLNKGQEFAEDKLEVIGGDEVAFDASRKVLPDGQTEVVWTVNPSADDMFSVKEQGEERGRINLDDISYDVTYRGLNVTNCHQNPEIRRRGKHFQEPFPALTPFTPPQISVVQLPATGEASYQNQFALLLTAALLFILMRFKLRK